MIGVDDSGNFIQGTSGTLIQVDTNAGLIQSAKAEIRCLQGTWVFNTNFGRSDIVWSLSQSSKDRSLDIFRIASRYAPVLSVDYVPGSNPNSGKYEVSFA